MPKENIQDIFNAVKECNGSKFVNASFKNLPFQSAIDPPLAIGAIYARFYVPWRHTRWPYSQSQLETRAKLGIKTSPPYFPVAQKLLPVAAAALALDVMRKLTLDP